MFYEPKLVEIINKPVVPDQLQIMLKPREKKLLVVEPIPIPVPIKLISDPVKTVNNKKEVKKTITITQKNPIYFPKQKDTLFWCFYIMKYGMDKYEMLKPTINIVIEKNIKIEYIEKLRKNKFLLKGRKIAPISHIENYLLNEFKIDIKTFFALCILENMNVVYIHKKMYYELFNNVEEEDEEEEGKVGCDKNKNDECGEVHVITKTEIGTSIKYGYYTNSPDMNEIKKQMYKIENLDKPLKSASSYKLEELNHFCEILGIATTTELGKKKTKNMLYENLVQYTF